MTDYFRKNYGDDENLGFEPLDEDESMENKLKEENYYKYHENVQEYDPRGQPFSYFYITVMGQIEFGEFLNMDGLAMKYNFVMGKDWNIANGDKSGAG